MESFFIEIIINELILINWQEYSGQTPLLAISEVKINRNAEKFCSFTYTGTLSPVLL
jgi:hypothetical protein